jgi:tetratricopeptide (TPR) repeat protein
MMASIQMVLLWILMASGAAAGELDAQLARGASALRQGDAVTALKAFQAVLQQAPNSWAAHEGMGRAWRVGGDLEAAQRELRLAVSLAPATASAPGHLADLIPLLPEEQRREAWAWLGEHAPQSFSIQMKVAGEAQLAGDLATAGQALSRALVLDPGNLRARVDQIRVARDALDYARAEVLAQAFIRDHPRYAETHVQLGRIYQLQNRLEDAARHYQKALQLDPEHPTALHRFAEIKMKEGDLPGAVKLLRTAVVVAPDHYQAHYLLGQAYSRLGDRDAAAREMAEFRRIKDAKRAHTRLSGGAAMVED